MVTRSTSESVVIPAATFSRPDCRIALTFSARAWRSISSVEASGHHQLGDGIGHGQYLENSGAAAVARGAAAAAGGLEQLQVRYVLLAESGANQDVIRQVHRLATGITKAPDQSLGDDETHRRGDVEWRDAHVDQSGQGTGRVVGVQSGKHEVTGLRGLDRDLGRFEVPYLADHQHIRILSQECAQYGGERQPDTFIDVDLVDTINIDLHRILDAGDIALGGVEEVDGGVERDGLTAAGGPGNQDHAVGLVCGLAISLELPFGHADRFQAEVGGRSIENPDNHFLAEQRRHGVDPEVDGAVAGKLDFHPSVLGHSALGDIQGREYLEAGNDLVHQPFRRVDGIMQHTVDTEADPGLALIGLDVDIRGALANGILQDLVDKADDGGVNREVHARKNRPPQPRFRGRYREGPPR